MELAGEIVFGIALILLMTSLIISAVEINMSVHALNIQLGEDIDKYSIKDE